MVAESFSKKILVISLQQLYSLACFLNPEENTSLKEYHTFDGMKSNYLFNQVNKWLVSKT